MITKTPDVLTAVPPGVRTGPRRLPAVVFAGTLAVYLLWWAAFYPGLMSFDSVTYVWQVTTGNWRADHSVLYDGLVWSSLKLTGDLALLTLGQAVAAAAALASLATAIRGLRVPGRWTAAAAVAVAALPATGCFVVTVWKDVPFSICAVAMTATLIRLTGRRRSAALFVSLAFEVLGLALFRNNGFLFAAIAAVLAVLLLPGLRRRLTLATVLPLALAFLLSAQVFPALGVLGVRPSLTYATAYSDIAVTYARRPSAFSRADLRLMAKVAPLAHWSSTATCYNADPTLNNGFDAGRADELNDKLVALWLRILKRAPDEVVGARLCRGSIAWVVFPGGPQERALIGSPNVPKDLYQWSLSGQTMTHSPYRPILATRPLSRSLHNAAAFARALTDIPQFEWLFWRGATWSYAGYLAVIAFAWSRRRRELLVAGAVVAGQQLGVLAAIPAQLFRYMAAPIMIGIMLVPLLVTAVATGVAQEKARRTR